VVEKEGIQRQLDDIDGVLVEEGVIRKAESHLAVDNSEGSKVDWKWAQGGLDCRPEVAVQRP
jgi:hypothetical protein